jgi:hypothetical protein
MSDTTPTSVPATAPAPELKTYHGNCHCGAVKYTVTLPEITSVTECDCSLCRRKGHKSLFPSGDLVFEEGKGEDKLKSYEFAGKNIAHKVCNLTRFPIYLYPCVTCEGWKIYNQMLEN